MQVRHLGRNGLIKIFMGHFMRQIKLLDCTLRDGAYIVDSIFGDSSIKGIIKKLQDADVDIIECGWLKDKPHEKGSSFFHVPEDVIPYFVERKEGKEYVAMIDWDRYNLDILPQYDGNSIDAIRVVFPYNKFHDGIEVGKKVKEKGYTLYFQAANTLAYSNNDLEILANEVNASGAKSLSVVDTFGAMYEEDLDRIVTVLDSKLNQDIAIGFHSHNNQQLAFSNAIHFIKLLDKSQRTIVVDSSLCGMGRGAGNATTELMVNYLNKKYDSGYSMNAIMDAIDIYMKHFEEQYKWGYSTEYCIAGMYCCHVNNIAYLTKNHRTSSKDMRNIIESLSPEDRKKYDYDLLEIKYIENQNRKVDDSVSFIRLKTEFANKKIVLIAPGKTSVSEKSKVDSFIRDNRKDVVVIATNALLDEYDHQYDYLFLTNYARYEYAKETKTNQFESVKKILLSSVKRDADKDEYVIEFERAIKRGWEHFDNAVICCLRLLKLLEVKDIYIAGFDGFKGSHNESYADTALPTVNPGKKWEELNEEIKEMFDDIKKSSSDQNIYFLTESLYE